MGNCCSIKKVSKFEDMIKTQMSNAIETNNVLKIKQLITRYTVPTMNIEPILNINKPIVKLFNHDMNALGYALFLGYTEAFIMILEQGQARISVMSKLYKTLNRQPIDIICELGHQKLLEYYLPFYMNKNDDIEEDCNVSVSLTFTGQSKNDKNKQTLALREISPIQKACEKERLGVIQYLWNYFQDKTVPNEFNVHYQDELSGDNCALVSCKTGNLEIMQYLYNACRADFHIYNKRRENAIQVMAVNSKKKPSIKFLDCFKFLVEVISVDYTYEFEETLLILQDKEIIEYLEDRLKNDGISIDKSKLEDKFSLSKNRVPPAINPALEMKLSRVQGPKFNFKELFEQELHDSDEDISSIHPAETILSLSQISFINPGEF